MSDLREAVTKAVMKSGRVNGAWVACRVVDAFWPLIEKELEARDGDRAERAEQQLQQALERGAKARRLLEMCRDQYLIRNAPLHRIVSDFLETRP